MFPGEIKLVTQRYAVLLTPPDNSVSSYSQHVGLDQVMVLLEAFAYRLEQSPAIEKTTIDYNGVSGGGPFRASISGEWVDGSHKMWYFIFVPIPEVGLGLEGEGEWRHQS